MLFSFHRRFNTPELHEALNRIRWPLYTLWLFTFSDLKTIIVPTSTFGIIGALSGPPLVTDSLGSEKILFRIPHIFFWTWSTLLPFAIQNQNGSSAIIEDSINKPWRPLPSGRISPKNATHYMIAFYCVNIAMSIHFGVQFQALSLLFLGTWYNRLGGADRSCLEKNFINAAGYMSFISGALGVAMDTSATAVTTGPIALPWLVSVGLVIATTAHTQDFEDMEGDLARGRHTVPLVIGENAARWSIAVAVPIWPVLLPWLFESQTFGYIGPAFLGMIIACRYLTKRGKQDDKGSFRLWNLWIVSLYTIPFHISESVFQFSL